MTNRVVGWLCDEEWICTYQSLFYGSLKDQYAALDVINLWRARFCGKVPVAIDATSRLLESWLEGSKVSSDAKRQLMSSAITQFVGLVTEKGLKGNSKKPIHEVGEDYGIPEWLINLRHEMAHGPLPSLQMLEKAVLFALDWLKDSHWDVQYAIAIKQKTKYTTNIKFPEQKPNDEKILKLLLDYVNAMLQKLNGNFMLKKKKQARTVMNNLDCLAQTNSETKRLCWLLVQHKFLVTHPRNYILALKSESESYHNYFKFWKCLFHLVANRQQLYVLLYNIVCEMNRHLHGSIAHSVLYACVEHIIGDVHNEAFFSTLHPAQKHDVLMVVAELYKDCKCSCSSKLLEIMQEIIPMLSNCSEIPLLKDLINGTKNKNAQEVACDKTYHLHDVTNSMRCSETVDMPVEDGIWKVYNGKSQTQLGLLDGQSANTLYKNLFPIFADTEAVITEDLCADAEMPSIETNDDMTTAVESTDVKSGLETLSENEWACLEKMLVAV